jgi:hypothetical protein
MEEEEDEEEESEENRRKRFNEELVQLFGDFRYTVI